MVFEYVDHTVLEELEENPKGLSVDKARSHVFQILRGIEFCHMNNVSEQRVIRRFHSFSAVRINIVKGRVGAFLVHATYYRIYLTAEYIFVLP